MKDLIQIFKLHANNTSHYLKNNDLRDKKTKNIEILKQKMTNYHQIIHVLFNNNGIDSHSKFLKLSSKLNKACSKENYKLVDILTRKKVEKNGLLFVLNEKEGTAGVLQNLTDKNNVIIPRSIDYNSKEFVVTTIHENSFKKSSKIESIGFPDDSKLLQIEENAFINSSLKEITIPASVSQLNEGWCSQILNLKINLNPNNQFYSNYENKFLLGKIDSKSDVFDILVYSLTKDETIKIPSFIKRIAPFAFYASHSVKTIEFDEDSKLQTIGKYAFAKSSLANISIPKSVTQIEKSAFYECEANFISFDVDSKLKDIGPRLFYGSGLKSITVPNSVTRICEYAFFSCAHLKSFKINEDSKLRVIEKSAFYNTKIESLSLPSTVELKENWNDNMPKIEEIKIYKKKIENIKKLNEFILGKSDIRSDKFDVILFADPCIEKVTIPSFIKSIASSAFSNCSKLEFIEFEGESQLETMGKALFENTLIRRIVIPSHVTQIEWNSLSFAANLNTIEFSENSMIESIFDFAFSHSSIEFISIPSSIINLNNCLYKTQSLNKIKIIPCKEKNITYLDDQLIIGKSDIKSNIFDVLLFAPRNIKKVFIPSYIKTIGKSAFNECNQLKSVTFADNSQLVSIENDAFSESSIESIVIPKSVIEIGECCFMNCSELKKVEFEKDSKLKRIGKNSFLSSSIKYINIPNHLTKIEKYLFEDCKMLKKIEFSENSNLRSIEKEAFVNTSLESIFIPRHVSQIAKGAFYISSLKTIEFENNSEIQFIDKSAFCYSNLECIKIPSSLICFGKNAFNICNNLQIIEIDEKAKIDMDTFSIENLKSASENCLVMIPTKIIRKTNEIKK